MLNSVVNTTIKNTKTKTKAQVIPKQFKGVFLKWTGH